MKNCIKKNIKINGNNILLYYSKKGEYINISDLANKSYDKKTTFNYAFFIFGDYFNEIINSKSYINDFEYDGVHCLPYSSLLDVYFEIVRRYSNSNVILDYESALEVLEAFKEIYREIDDYFKWSNSNNFIVPLKGGGFVINLFDLKEKNIFPVEAKRIPLKNIGSFGFGMNLEPKELETLDAFGIEINGSDVTFLEVCVASGMTTIGFLIDLYIRGVKPKKVKVVTAASSTQGIKLVKSVAKQLNIDVEFFTGKLIENVGDFYNVSQDSIIYDDGAFVVKSPENAYRIVYGI